MRCMQLLFLLQGTEVHRVQLGARAEQSHVKKTKKTKKKQKNKRLAPAVRSRESAALLQITAKTLMPETHRIYNGGTIIHAKPMQRNANVNKERWDHQVRSCKDIAEFNLIG